MSLSSPQMLEVLRYWLAVVRQEEALAARPRARKPPSRPLPIDLRDPGQGIGYLRLDRALTLLTRAEPRWLGPMDAATQAFFERWLRVRYRAESAAARGRPEQAQPTWFVGWPVVHFEGRGELASLLRFEVDVGFRTADDKRFQAPSWADRRAGRLPPPPTTIRLSAPAPDAGSPWFSADPLLLGRTLGVDEETLSELFAALDGEVAPPAGQVVAAVCQVLDPDGPPLPADAPPVAQMDRLITVMRARLPDGVKVYPVGLVYDGSAAFATWHLQRDLAELVRRPPGRAPWSEGTALCAALGQRPGEIGWQPLAAAAHPRGLTEGQQRVAERFLGSALTAAQGPPGTGKTELIGALAAHGVAARAQALADGAEMPDDVLMVTSTNNRAVDNALDPLAVDLPPERLPIALRVGSQPVVAHATTEVLNRTLAWLDAECGEGDAEADYQAALARLRAVQDALAERRGPQVLYRQRVAHLAKVEARLAELPAGDGADVPPEVINQALHALRPMLRRVDQLQSALVPGGASALREVLTLTRRMQVRDQPKLEKALIAVGRPLTVGLPPAMAADLPVDDQVDRWEAEVGELSDALEAAQVALLALRAERKAAQRRAELEVERADLQALVADVPPPADRAELNQLAHAVYERAIEARERWAVSRAEPLRQALSRAVAVAYEVHSLRRLFEEAPDVETWLRRLFPVWGCTLLSLGNTFPAEPACLDRVVIDEAGQCHPAYAVSALLRAHRALVIGDVHQLEPVVQLTPSDERRAQRQAELTLSAEALAPFRVAAAGGSNAQALVNGALGAQALALTDHFRCQPEIIALSDRLCGYDLTVHTPARSLSQWVPLLTAPVLFAPMKGAQQRARGSWINEAEVHGVLRLLDHLRRGGVPPEEIAVITPYVAQLDLLRAALREMGVPHGEDGGVATGTVHRFQGGERTVVLFSTVVTRPRSLRFLNTRVNLVNVAVSRAKDHLITLGDAEVLTQGKHTRLLVEEATWLS